MVTYDSVQGLRYSAQQIIDFCRYEYRMPFVPYEGQVMLFALEGANSDLSENPDYPDLWNDCILQIKIQNGIPQIVCANIGTCEPGRKSTNSPAARALGGVARIALGWHEKKWKRGFHKGIKGHPALVQAAPIMVHRDLNRDMKRTGDPITMDVKGLNWHGTSKTRKAGKYVANWSAGCIVSLYWMDHIQFMDICASDPGAENDPDFLFSGCVVDWGKFCNKAKSEMSL